MIKIKNGEIQCCEIHDVIQFDFDNDKIISETLYDYPLRKEVCILEIPKDSSKPEIYELCCEHNHLIPRISEYENEFHNIFWNSNETYVFGSFDEALKYISNYDGYYKREIEDLYGQILESFLVEETVAQFSNLDELDKEFDVDFLNELEELVYSKNISMNSVLTSMKMFMLDKYRRSIQEKRLSRLN